MANNSDVFKKDLEILGKDILKHPLKYVSIFVALIVLFKLFV